MLHSLCTYYIVKQTRHHKKMFLAILVNIIIISSFYFNNTCVLKKCFNNHVTAYAKYTLQFSLFWNTITMFSLQCFSKPRPVCCLCAQQGWEMLSNLCLQHNNVLAHTLPFVHQFWHMTTIPTLHKPERYLCDPPYFQKSRLYSKGKDTS
jgi:hypothetical protein